jgi:hypothetical protein
MVTRTTGTIVKALGMLHYNVYSGKQVETIEAREELKSRTPEARL